MHRRGRIGGGALALLAALALLCVSGAQAAVQNASVVICDNSCLFATGTTGVAGDDPGFFVKFKVPAGFDGASDWVAIDASTLAPTTRFSSNKFDYQISFGSATHAVLGSANVFQNAQRVVLFPGNSSLTVPPDGEMAVQLGGPTKPGAVRNPTVVGNSYRFSVETNKDSAAQTSTFTIVPDAPANLSWFSGAGQSAEVGSAFSDPVSVRLTDQWGNPISGQQVTFSAPASGPRGSFDPASASTDSAGLASTIATAGQLAGPWELTASGPNGVTAKTTMVNVVGPPAWVAVALDPPRLIADGVSSGTAEATIIDLFGNPLPGREVSVSTDGDERLGPVTDLGDGRYSATVTAGTTPGDSTITFKDEASGLSGQATLVGDPDLKAPRVKLLEAPKRVVRRPRVRLRFSSNAPDLAGFQCKLDKRPFKACRSPKRYRLKRGNHRIRVRAVDLAGNRGKAKTVRVKRVKRVKR